MRSRRLPHFIVGALACAGGLAFAACSSGSLMANAGTGAGGGSGTVGTGSGGTGGTALGTGSGGFVSCPHPARITSCSPDAGTLPTAPDETSPCTVEGARCEGTHCFDFGDAPFVTTCCVGRWRPNFTGECPGPFQPGDPFLCTATLNCAIGQTYCSSSNADRTEIAAQSCQPICAAGDCTCFCDKAEGCDFNPPGSTCPADICHCHAVTAGPSITVPGAVTVRCDYVVPDSGICYLAPSVDARCGGLSYAVLCAGGTDGPDAAGCTPLYDPGSTASCGADVQYYCCNS